MYFDKKSTVLITCAPHLVDTLAGQINSLGFETHNPHAAGVETFATLNECMTLNLHLRYAFNVLYLLKEFKAKNPDQLYRYALSLDWADIIAPDEYISIVTRVDTAAVNNSMFAAVRLKDAIVDRISKRTDKRPDSGPEKNNVVINLYWKDNNCWLYLNTSGVKLADRNYRKIPMFAPMQETLAAAVIAQTAYDGTVPFVCPMCGSGTLPIEAALIALNKAPGLLRSNFGFMHIKGFDPQKWQNLRKNTLKSAKKILSAPIIASDIDPKAVDAASQNARTAGVDHLIEFQTCDFEQTKIPPAPGIIIMNPEYGRRLGEEKKLESTYKRIGDFFKNKCPGYSAYVFTGNLELAKKIGLKTNRRIPFLNGSIDCRLLEYQIYKGTKKPHPS